MSNLPFSLTFKERNKGREQGKVEGWELRVESQQNYAFDNEKDSWAHKIAHTTYRRGCLSEIKNGDL